MNWIIGLIIGCEIAFWVFVILGLFTRYILQKKKLGLLFLAMSPVVDLVLLVASGYDLVRGGTANYPHALAAVYIGISVGFGKSMIAWADGKFQEKVLGRKIPKDELYGLAFAKKYARGWLRHILAYVVGGGLIAAIVFWVGDLERTKAMVHVLGIWSVVLIIDTLTTFSYFIFPKRPVRG